jgi:ATP synthase subunit 6
MFSRCLFLVSSLSSPSLFVKANRFNTFFYFVDQKLSGLFPSVSGKLPLSALFVFLCFSNFLGNIPSSPTPSQFYSFVFVLRISFWLPILFSALTTDLKAFFAHMYPQGAPLALIVLLPLVEFISISLRPIILVVRLCTNLAAGHILLLIFSYFTTLLPLGSPVIGILLIALYFMELGISLLQAYIFVNLLRLYISDTLFDVLRSAIFTRGYVSFYGAFKLFSRLHDDASIVYYSVCYLYFSSHYVFF